MVVEPESLCWLTGRMVPARDGVTWAAEFALFPAPETAWKQAKSAFAFFTPEGRLNDRSQAAAIIAAALPDLGGAAWAKTRRLLLRGERFTFLDQVHTRLAGLGLDRDVLSALLDL